MTMIQERSQTAAKTAQAGMLDLKLEVVVIPVADVDRAKEFYGSLGWRLAHTCIEATVRFAAELGYDVTVVRDATADYSDEMMHAALDINMPNYASAIVTTDEIVEAIASA